jgi:hypothetical protein
VARPISQRQRHIMRRCSSLAGSGRVWGVCALGEGDRNGPCHELWHHT